MAQIHGPFYLPNACKDPNENLDKKKKSKPHFFNQKKN